jgi:hypothetical protein
MAYNGKPFFRIPRPLLLDGGVEATIMSGDITLENKDSMFQILDADGADREVILPAAKNGLIYGIKNDGSANNIVIKDAAATTIETLAFGEGALLVCNGTDWFAVIKA